METENMATMKERIKKLMDYTGLSQQDFAARLELSASTLSGVFNGRSNPTANHVAAVHKAFPEININWLMFGEGEMLSGAAAADAVVAQEGKLFPEASVPAYGSSLASDGGSPASPYPSARVTSTLFPHIAQHDGGTEGRTARPSVADIAINVDKKPPKIKEIRVFFDDGTYEAFVPSSK